MKVHLAGHLSWYPPQKSSWFEMEAPPQTKVENLLEQLGVPLAEVAVILVNGKLMDMKGEFLCNEDVVEIFPPIAGG